MKVIFLDIDGVLNRHQQHENGYCGTDPECVRHFNRLLANAPDWKIVISSAWRYLILNGAMTLKGFESMLLTHGLNVKDRIAGRTRADHHRDEPRRLQITDWLAEQSETVESILVIDDLELYGGDEPEFFIKTRPDIGFDAWSSELASIAVNGLGAEDLERDQ